MLAFPKEALPPITLPTILICRPHIWLVALYSKALFEVCRSLPFPSEGTGLDWGHDFGGLVFVDNQDRYSWVSSFSKTSLVLAA
jgi:hypothetical protein